MALRHVTLALLASASLAPTQQPAPRTGEEVLARMHAAYDGRWYHTLTFTQTTTIHRPETAPIIETWYESLRHTPQQGVQLRIDRGAPSLGNGLLYTADSAWIMRNGALATIRGEGNEFLPLIEGVYVQPVALTTRQVSAMHIDLSKVRAAQWMSRPAWVVGADANDSTSAQFWVDVERNVLVRMVIAPGGQPPLDIVLDRYEPAGRGWLATRVTMSAGGTPRQTEVYTDWKTDVPLAPGLFDPATWTSAPHWVSKQ